MVSRSRHRSDLEAVTEVKGLVYGEVHSEGMGLYVEFRCLNTVQIVLLI